MILAELPHAFVVATCVALGLVFGSFTNVVIHRWPRGESVVSPRSRCGACGEPIAAYDNLPVLGWLLLRGRARCCGARISPRYPAVEAVGGLLAWALAERALALLPGLGDWRAVAGFATQLALGLGLVAAAFIDLEHMLVPDEVSVGGAALGGASAALALRPGTEVPDSILGAAVGFAVVWLPFDLLHRAVRGKPGMGLGDAKLCLLAGAWFGWRGAVFTLVAGAVQGTLAVIALYAGRGRIDEPEAVRAERAAMRVALEQASPEERAALERELASDPIAEEPEPGWRGARMALGPFLALAILELLLFEEAIFEAWERWVLGG
ncbi:MAG: prepilin peptidase [Polyangiaceae bacterium]|nr:prepilin peptidase [Polyangiaceae bacterium]